MADHDLHDVAFHRLDEAQMAMLAQCSLARLEPYRDGETLIDCGERDFKFFVVKSGEVAILDNSDPPKLIAVVGVGNSAGQAAVYLAGIARKVYLVVRGPSLYKDMSSYLAWRIEQTPTIEVLLNTTALRMEGDKQLDAVEVVDNRTGEARTLHVAALFSFIGAVPRTDWLPPEIEKDEKQFLRTGGVVAGSPHWNVRRQPFLLETSRPGVFAAGDVRSGSVKRVASAVGEGAMAVAFVHEYLNEM